MSSVILPFWLAATVVFAEKTDRLSLDRIEYFVDSNALTVVAELIVSDSDGGDLSP